MRPDPKFRCTTTRGVEQRNGYAKTGWEPPDFALLTAADLREVAQCMDGMPVVAEGELRNAERTMEALANENRTLRHLLGCLRHGCAPDPELRHFAPDEFDWIDANVPQ